MDLVDKYSCHDNTGILNITNKHMDKEQILKEHFSKLGKLGWKSKIEGKTPEEIKKMQSDISKGKKIKQ
jgi:hypothetical protein